MGICTENCNAVTSVELLHMKTSARIQLQIWVGAHRKSAASSSVCDTKILCSICDTKFLISSCPEPQCFQGSMALSKTLQTQDIKSPFKFDVITTVNIASICYTLNIYLRGLNLVRDVNSNKKGFYRCISDTRKSSETVGSLQKEMVDLLTQDMEKAEVVHDFFTSVFIG